MGTHKNKSEIAWLVTLLLERDTPYSAGAIDTLIRESIRADLLNEPQYAPDHIRLAMLENQFIERDAVGASYRVHPFVLLPHENTRLYRNLLKQTKRADSFSFMRCPICDHSCVAHAILDHFRRTHPSAELWETLINTYAR